MCCFAVEFASGTTRSWTFLTERYRRRLRWCLGHRGLTVGVGVATLAGSLFLWFSGVIGSEFLPHLDEGAIWARGTLANSTSLTEGERFTTSARYVFASFPEVTTVVSEVGRPDDGTDTGGFGNTEYFVDLKPHDQWRPVFHKNKEELIAAMDRELQKRCPGAIWNYSQPIEDNVGETMTGTKGSLAFKIFGDDLKTLEEKGEEVVGVMSGIPGMHDVKLLRDFGQPNLDITIDRRQAARFGINVADIQDAVQTAVGGNAVSQVLQGEARYDVVVRYQEPYRKTQDAIARVRLLSPTGERVSLAQLAKVEVKDGAYDIYREGNGRYLAITFNVRGRDLGTTVEEAIKQIGEKVKMPPGYHRRFVGRIRERKTRGSALVDHRAHDYPRDLHHSLHDVQVSEVGAAHPHQRGHGANRRTGGAAGDGHALQRVVRRWLLGAVRRFGANRSHHARIHQPAPRAGLHHRGCRHRRRRLEAASRS